VAGHDFVAAGGPSDEQDQPDDVAERSGILASAAA